MFLIEIDEQSLASSGNSVELEERKPSSSSPDLGSVIIDSILFSRSTSTFSIYHHLFKRYLVGKCIARATQTQIAAHQTQKTVFAKQRTKKFK